MANALTTLEQTITAPGSSKLQRHEFVTLRLGDQLFGISVMAVQDVMRRQNIAPVPLAAGVIAGSLNVRGRIVTALDMRKLLGMANYPEPERVMKVVIEHQHELYALMVDAVGDVLSLPVKQLEKVPSNLDPAWRLLASHVCKLEQELLIIFDVAHVVERITE